VAQDLFTVGQFAVAASVTVSTLHYWERVGLLQPARRSSAGYRLYDLTQVAETHRIRELQALGFLKAQIVALREAVASSEPEETKREQVRAFYERHLTEVQGKAQRYADIERRLRATTSNGLLNLLVG
jgi:DNA-binding transcriptional MerR regulator